MIRECKSSRLPEVPARVHFDPTAFKSLLMQAIALSLSLSAGVTQAAAIAVNSNPGAQAETRVLSVVDTGLVETEAQSQQCADQSQIVDDFEDSLLPSGSDGDGVSIGFLTFSASSSVAISSTQQTDNTVLQIDIDSSAFAGVIHSFENDAVDTWVSQDWSDYLSFNFRVFGQNTGTSLFVDIKDNRNPGSTTDDAELWTYYFSDDFSGWKTFQVPFDNFTRKEIGNGAPNDGLGLTEVHGWAFGTLATPGEVTWFLDDFQVCGTAPPPPLNVGFDQANVSVNEGETAFLAVSLNRPATEPVFVDYVSAESTATANRQYTAVSGSLEIKTGETTATIEIPTFADGKHTGDRRVVVNLFENSVPLGFTRRSVMKIVETDVTDPRLVDDFEGFHPYSQQTGATALASETISSGEPGAVPGQGAFEDVLSAEFDTSVTPASFFRPYSRAQDWSGFEGLSFWFFGNNSGNSYTLELLDNRSNETGTVDPEDWVMVWSDEFNEPAGMPPNPDIWQRELGDGALNEILGWGNSELQYYTDDPNNAATDGNGNLVIRQLDVDPDTTDLVCWYGPCEYTSARLTTQRRLDFEYGRIEARIRVPNGPSGLWAAFWMLGADNTEEGWPQTGEIDVMEYVSRSTDEVFGTIHGPGYSGGSSFGGIYNLGGPVADSFHTFTIDWRPDSIDWYVDGILYHQATPQDVAPNEWVFNHPFFLLLNTAIGGNFAGAVDGDIGFPQETLVDYVRVFQAIDTAERFQSSFVDDFNGWQEIQLPFEDFIRSGSQPTDAPDDGLTLTEVQGYGLLMPAGTSGSFKMDRVYNWIKEIVFKNGFE